MVTVNRNCSRDYTDLFVLFSEQQNHYLCKEPSSGRNLGKQSQVFVITITSVVGMREL